MKEINISDNERGKRLDKFLTQFFPGCSAGFLYKMLRKKNITLNGKKATGKEVLAGGDVIKVFFSDETFDKFANRFASGEADTSEYERAYRSIKGVAIIYEDSDIMILDKPAGVLSQKAEGNDISINEWLVGYLLDKGICNADTLKTFRPSVLNRLDRNTSGLILGSVSLEGARQLSQAIKDRTLNKYYRTIVSGRITKDQHIKGYLLKDERTNTVKLIALGEERIPEGASPIETSFKVISHGHLPGEGSEGFDLTELEVHLITGKPHQIRAHLSSTGHPIIGDTKYGDLALNKAVREAFGLKHQLLHAYRYEFPALTGSLAHLSGREFVSALPKSYTQIELT